MSQYRQVSLELLAMKGVRVDRYDYRGSWWKRDGYVQKIDLWLVRQGKEPFHLEVYPRHDDPHLHQVFKTEDYLRLAVDRYWLPVEEYWKLYRHVDLHFESLRTNGKKMAYEGWMKFRRKFEAFLDLEVN